MKKTLDKMARIVIPQELRQKYGIKPDETEVEIFDGDGFIIIKKAPERKCIACNELEGTFQFKGNYYCEDCIKELITKVVEEGL